MKHFPGKVSRKCEITMLNKAILGEFTFRKVKSLEEHFEISLVSVERFAGHKKIPGECLGETFAMKTRG